MKTQPHPTAPDRHREAAIDKALPASDLVGSQADQLREEAVDAALAKLDLDAKTRLLAGQDVWTLPALPEIGLASVVMSDGPIGVRGLDWTSEDPSIALPSPTALAAAWDPALARRAGHLLAQEARRKGVHVLLAPTVNLQRSPLGGRHFEAYSEDPVLTGEIATGYVTGVQQGGVGTTPKHFVANDAETERFTVNNTVDGRTLRELYLAPFEKVVKDARPWGLMAAYNSVNGTTMTEHAELNNGVLRGEWGYDGYLVSDWLAARDTAGSLLGGTDLAMPGPQTVYGPALAAAVRAGTVPQEAVDAAVRRVLRLAARVGALEGAPPAVAPGDAPSGIDGAALAREIARRSFVLLRNENRALPLDAAALSRIALIGAAAMEARVLGGGSAQVFPEHVVSPYLGLRAALPGHVELTYALGANPRTSVPPASEGFELRSVFRAVDGRVLHDSMLPDGQVLCLGTLPAGVDVTDLHSVEITGFFTPRLDGVHTLAIGGIGRFTLTLGEQRLFDGTLAPESDDLFANFLGNQQTLFEVAATAGDTRAVSLRFEPQGLEQLPIAVLRFALAHSAPLLGGPELLIERAVAAATAADAAIVVVATTEEVESEGFDRSSLALPGRQDELVARVAAANPNTIVVVNAGSPVEMPWREDVAAVLLTWFPGQEAGAALADVLLGDHEPGGRLPTTWPARLGDCPVVQVTPDNGELPYTEGIFIGYRAWEQVGAQPAYCFGHGLGYTQWSYEQHEFTPAAGGTDGGRSLGTLTVRVRNTGHRPGRETIQVYLSPEFADPDRPARWLAGFANVETAAGRTAEASIEIPRRAAEVWDSEARTWRLIPGRYTLQVGHSLQDQRSAVAVELP